MSSAVVSGRGTLFASIVHYYRKANRVCIPSKLTLVKDPGHTGAGGSQLGNLAEHFGILYPVMQDCYICCSLLKSFTELLLSFLGKMSLAKASHINNIPFFFIILDRI